MKRFIEFNFSLEESLKKQSDLGELFYILLKNDTPYNILEILAIDQFKDFFVPPNIINTFIYVAMIKQEWMNKNTDNPDVNLFHILKILEQLFLPLESQSFFINTSVEILIPYIDTINSFIRENSLKSSYKTKADINEDLLLTLESYLLFFADYTNEISNLFNHRIFEFKNVKGDYIHIYDYLEEKKESKSTAYNNIWQFSKFENAYEIKDSIVMTLKTKYKLLEPMDDEFKTMFDYLGYIEYHGWEHHLYEMTHNELESEIYNYIQELKTPDLAMLFEDIDTATEDFISDVEDWKDFRNSLFQTDEMETIIKEMKQHFLLLLPPYDPYSEKDNND